MRTDMVTKDKNGVFVERSSDEYAVILSKTTINAISDKKTALQNFIMVNFQK